MTNWKRVTPIPPEFNGHGYLFTCKKCHSVTTYLGGKKYPPYDCPKCKANNDKEKSYAN